MLKLELKRSKPIFTQKDIMMDFIKDLGIGVEPNATDTEGSDNNTSESNKDLSLEPEGSTEPSKKEEAVINTEDNKLMDSLQKQIDGMEKRIADKDDYIKQLRETSKSEEQAQDSGDTEEGTFWDNPEETVKSLQDTIKLQAMQMSEIQYSNTVDGYWKTVNQDALKEAVATDTEFAETFNGSREPYKVAYEYLTKKAETKTSEADSLKEQIRQELIKEMGLETKAKKETIPSVANIGSSSGNASSKSDASEDGFSAVFGA
jgi:TolA-binding protein